MPIEIKMLVFSTLLGLLQLFAATYGATSQRGIKWNFSARDEKMPELTGSAARLDRAFKNFSETFPFFAVAVLLISFMKTTNHISDFGSQLYFYARILYVPLYLAGIPIVRTCVWLIATAGIFMVLSAVI